MLKKLSIDNYALIDKSEIDFENGFTVITGETGAGKSIMLDALMLLKGARADSKSMGNKERKTIVEGVFSESDLSIGDLMEENGIDRDNGELILRREISPSGKSRGFVNDTPVNLSVLSEVADRLLDIHTQHSNSLLNKPKEQLAIIDSYGETDELLTAYKDIFHRYVALRKELKEIKEKIKSASENQEFLKFRLEQLDKLKPRRGELESLEKELEILGDADKIKSDLRDSYLLIGGEAGSALRFLQNAAAVMERIDFDLLDATDENLIERLNNLRIELRDISDTLEGYEERIDSDPERFEKVRQRIEDLYEAMKRFKVKDESELIGLYEQLKKEYATIGGDKTDITRREQELKELARALKEAADSLSDEREKAAEEFSDILRREISPLGLPNIEFKVENQRGKLTSDGQDSITFYCSFNKNHKLQPISEIASGGEISRVMLGIKSLMATHIQLPTIIFDEIDTGVSGEIAHKMGEMMKEMAGGLQVVAVTHLPQVASQGDSHLKVYKADDDEKTTSNIKLLNEEERIREIAGMLSGDTINEAAIENARILLKKR